MKKRFSFVYNLRAKQLAPHQKAFIRIEVYFSRTVRSHVDTNVAVEPCYWNAKAKVLKNNHPNYVVLYQLLRQAMDSLEKFELSLLNQGRELTPALLAAYKQELKRGSVAASGATEGSGESFLAFSHNYLDERLTQGKIGYDTHERYSSCLNLLEKIVGGDLSFAGVNERLVGSLDAYLAAHGYAQPTIGRFHNTVKMFVAAAVQQELLDPKKNPYKNYTVALGKSERGGLEPAELQLLENVDRKVLGSERLAQVLDRFLYSCYTGLRIGDNILLSKRHIKKTADGLVVDMVTEKGKGKRVVHHLAHLFGGKPQAIVEKYLQLYPEQPTIFPSETRSALDYYLKIVAKKVGVERNLFFHMARHTCGTMLADISANPYLIMDIMGHSSIKTSMIYIHSSSERVKKQLQSLTWKW